MNKFFQYFWHPAPATVKGFKYGAFLFLAPALLLSFILPGIIVVSLILLFFLLKALISIRSAITNDMEEEKLKKYSDDPLYARRAFIIFTIILSGFMLGIVILGFVLGGIVGFTASIFSAIIVLPGFFEEIIIIKRCQNLVQIET